LPTEEQNKASFRRYLEEAWNQSNLEVVDEIFDRYISHQPDGSVLERGPEDVKRLVGEFRSAFPDLRISMAIRYMRPPENVSSTHSSEQSPLAPQDLMRRSLFTHERVQLAQHDPSEGGGKVP